MKSKHMLLTVAVFLSIQTQAATTIWGLNNIHKINYKSSAPYTVIVGSYNNYENAQKMVSQFKAKGYDSKIKKNNDLYVVSIGPFSNRETLYNLAPNSNATTVKNIPSSYIAPNSNATTVKNKSSSYIAPNSNTTTVKNKPSSNGERFFKRFFKRNQNKKPTYIIKNQPRVIEKPQKNRGLEGKMGPLVQQPNWTWLASLSLGPTWDNGGETQTFFLTPSIEKTYTASESNNAFFDGEVFLALQKTLTQKITAQLGLEVAATSNAGLSGRIWDDAEPEFDNYTYSYQIQHTHVAVQGKLLTDMVGHGLLPWVSLSLGVGFNYSSSFKSTPIIFEAVPSPGFDSNTVTSFTYSVGIGIQKAWDAHWQIGAGYEFSDWGRSQLSPSEGQTLDNSLTLDHLYTNGLLFNITYLG